MKMTVIGAGPIGLVTALSFTHFEHDVLCVDLDPHKVQLLNDGVSDIYEPELESYLKLSLLEKRIRFSTDYNQIQDYSEVIFIAVGTPTCPQKGCDLSALKQALTSIAKVCKNETAVVVKSTVPPGTQNDLQKKYPQFLFASCPEFLREGQAFKDALHPDRVIVGSDHPTVIQKLQEIYLPFLKSPTDFLVMNPASAELAKYAANSFLAARISLINEFSRLCEKTGADITKVSHALGKDHRIGPYFLNAGIGYGGSCFPKDLQALLHFAESHHEEMTLIRAVHKVNQIQIQNFTERILTKLETTPSPVVCLWGAAFKPETNDIREAPSLKVIEILLQNDYKLHIYDPSANDNVANYFSTHPHFANLRFFQDKIKALQGADALAILTEWAEFYDVSLPELKKNLRRFQIFDGRNVLSQKERVDLELHYSGVGLST